MEIKSASYRNMHLKVRNAMTPEEVAEKSRKMVRILLASAWYRQAAEVFVYSPIGKEADCRGLIEQAWRDGKRVAFPRVESENRINFYYVDCYGDLAEGSFHVAEPKMGCRPAVPDNQPVLVPGSVFDRHGNRYGYQYTACNGLNLRALQGCLCRCNRCGRKRCAGRYHRSHQL